MIKYLLSSIILFLGSLDFCTAQLKINGTVSDGERVPLPYSTVSLKAKNSDTPKVIQADSMGHFSFGLLTPGAYSLTIHALGYSTGSKILSLIGDTSLSFILEPLEGRLKEVTVIGSKPVIERRADRVIFNVDNSIQAAGSNGLEVLKKAPGIRIGNHTIGIAGKGNVSVMLNGRLLHLSDKALVDYLKSFSSENISKIEIITHPSAKYDAEGNAGLINIITKKSIKPGWSGNIAGSIKRFFYKDQPDYKGIQNYGDVDGNLSLSYNNDKWSAYTHVDYTTGRELWGYGIGVHYPHQFWDMKDTGEYRIATLNVLAGANYKISPNTTVGGEYNYVYHLEDGADYVNLPVYNNQGALDSSIRTFATYYPIAKSNAFNVHLIQKLSPSGAKLTLNADYFNSFRTDRSDLDTWNNTDGQQKNFSSLYDTTLQNIKIYTFKGDVDVPTPFAQFTMGAKLSFIDNYSNIFYYHKKGKELILDPGLSNEFRYIENTQAVYANGSKERGDWKWEAGLRAEITQTKARSYYEDEEIKKTYLKLFPSLSASYKMDPDNNFSFNYNKRIHRPTFWNMNPYKSFMSAYTYVEGNPYLEPEYITNIELTHQYKSRLTSSLYINITNNGFAQVIETKDTGAYTHVTTMHNFIKSYRYGISGAITLHPFYWWETSNMIRGYHTKVHSSLDYVDGIAGWGVYLETNNTFYLNRAKTFSGFLGFWYQFPEIDHFGRTNAYYNVDAGLQWTTLQKKLNISLNFSDIFQSSAYKIHTTVKNLRNTYTAFQLNSQLRLSASWSFGGETQREPTHTGNEAERNRLN